MSKYFITVSDIFFDAHQPNMNRVKDVRIPSSAGIFALRRARYFSKIASEAHPPATTKTTAEFQQAGSIRNSGNPFLQT